MDFAFAGGGGFRVCFFLFLVDERETLSTLAFCCCSWSTREIREAAAIATSASCGGGGGWLAAAAALGRALWRQVTLAFGEGAKMLPRLGVCDLGPRRRLQKNVGTPWILGDS